MQYIALLLLNLLLYICLSSCECPSHLVERPVQTPNGVVHHCCQPISATACHPGTQVEPCLKNLHPDWCKPCEPGLVQESYSGTGYERPCVRSNIICTPEEDQVLVNGVPQCLCRTAQGYCGEPKNCLKVATACPEGFQLHHRDCNCTHVVTEKPTSVPVTEISTLSTSSASSEPSSSDLTSTVATTPFSLQNATSPQQDVTKGGNKRLADAPPSPQAVEDSSRTPKGSTDQTTFIVVLAVIAVMVIVVLAAVILAVFCHHRGQAHYHANPAAMMFCNWCAKNSIQAASDVERGEIKERLMDHADPPNVAPEEIKKAVEEQGDCKTEEGNVGAAPDETLLKHVHPFCQELNPRTSVETFQ